MIEKGVTLEGSEKLHLVIIYSASENIYSLSMHNEPREQTEKFVADFNPHMKPGFTLITLEQHKAHKTKDVQDCQACRETVRRSSGLEPLPKFTRRKE